MICRKCITNLGFREPPTKPVPCRCSVCLVFDKHGHSKDSILKPHTKETLAAAFSARLLAIKKKKARYASVVSRYYKLLNEEVSLRQMHRLVDQTRTEVVPVVYPVTHDYTRCVDAESTVKKAEKAIKGLSETELAQLMEVLKNGN